jgi:hypothetical protein
MKYAISGVSPRVGVTIPSMTRYCPGCVVQLYYGLGGVFSEGVVKSGIRRHSGRSTHTFAAPSEPGVHLAPGDEVLFDQTGVFSIYIITKEIHRVVYKSLHRRGLGVLHHLADHVGLQL